MSADEIVRALRSCSNHDTRKPDCDNCPLFGERLCVKKMLEGGADLIESLQAQLTDKTAMLDAAIVGQETLQRALAEHMEQLQNAQIHADCMEAKAIAYEAELRESQRRERAAVEDMKLIVDAVREEHCDETCCFACAFDCDTSINDSGVPNCECPGFERDDCFEWRGPQEAAGVEQNNLPTAASRKGARGNE